MKSSPLQPPGRVPVAAGERRSVDAPSRVTSSTAEAPPQSSSHPFEGRLKRRRSSSSERVPEGSNAALAPRPPAPKRPRRDAASQARHSPDSAWYRQVAYHAWKSLLNEPIHGRTARALFELQLSAAETLASNSPWRGNVLDDVKASGGEALIRSNTAFELHQLLMHAHEPSLAAPENPPKMPEGALSAMLPTEDALEAIGANTPELKTFLMERILFAVVGRVTQGGVCHMQNLSLLAHHAKRAAPAENVQSAGARLPFPHTGVRVRAPDHPPLWGEVWGDGVHAVLESDFRGAAPGDAYTLMPLSAEAARRFAAEVEATVKRVSENATLADWQQSYAQSRRAQWERWSAHPRGQAPDLGVTGVAVRHGLDVLSDAFLGRARARAMELDELPEGAPVKRMHAQRAALDGAFAMDRATSAERIDRIEEAMGDLIAGSDRTPSPSPGPEGPPGAQGQEQADRGPGASPPDPDSSTP